VAVRRGPKVFDAPELGGPANDPARRNQDDAHRRQDGESPDDFDKQRPSIVVGQKARCHACDEQQQEEAAEPDRRRADMHEIGDQRERL